jgi:hypothetical protein
VNAPLAAFETADIVDQVGNSLYIINPLQV